MELEVLKPLGGNNPSISPPPGLVWLPLGRLSWSCFAPRSGSLAQLVEPIKFLEFLETAAATEETEGEKESVNLISVLSRGVEAETEQTVNLISASVFLFGGLGDRQAVVPSIFV